MIVDNSEEAPSGRNYLYIGGAFDRLTMDPDVYKPVDVKNGRTSTYSRATISLLGSEIAVLVHERLSPEDALKMLTDVYAGNIIVPRHG